MKKFITLIVFGTAFGLLEAIVVIYLQKILGSSAQSIQINRVFLNVGVISFVSTNHPILQSTNASFLESIREGTTIIMLASLAYISGISLKQKLEAFLISFATWDICYYLFLRILTGWPNSLFAVDVYFLIPVTWVGPIITPLIVSILLLTLGTIMFFNNNMRIEKENNE